VSERGHGMSDESLYLWVRIAKEQSSTGSAETSQLKAEVFGSKLSLKESVRSVTS